MCPFCWTTMALMAASATSVGGLAVLSLKLSRKNKLEGDNIQNSNQRRDRYVYERNSETQGSIAK
jgi:hypothetical protein